MRIPSFINDEQRAWFLNESVNTGWQFHVTQTTDGAEHNRDYLAFQTNNGQLWVFGGARYSTEPHPDDWHIPVYSHCMGHRNRVVQFREEPPQPGDEIHEELALGFAVRAWEFQHHFDHSIKVIAAAAHMFTPSTTLLASKAVELPPATREMLSWWPQLNASRISVNSRKDHWAKRVIYSCRSPLVHPYSLQYYHASVLGEEASHIPLESRKVVLFVSRNGKDPSRTHAGARSIINEPELLAALNASLQARGQGERLMVMHNPFDTFSNYTQFARFVNREVRAVVGAHGGALHNAFFMAPNATLLEIIPRPFDMCCGWTNIWMNTEALEIQYSAYFGQTVQQGIHVNVGEVVQLLEKTLGKPPPQPLLRHHYEWIDALEMAGRPIS